MTRERIEDFREIVLPFVKKRLLETNYENLGESDAEMFAKDFDEILNLAIKALEQEPCDDVISRKSIKQKLQEHHDFFVNAYGGFSNLPQNDKSRVDEITNCIAMVVNEPSVTPQEPRWIPVSERLPEDKTYVLVTIGIPGRQPHARSGWYQDGFFHNDNGDCWRATDIEVKAWMPLPAPYESQESEIEDGKID